MRFYQVETKPCRVCALWNVPAVTESMDGADGCMVPRTVRSAERALRSSLASFEMGYLSNSVSRLHDPVNLMFASGAADGALPSLEECDNLVRIIQR